MYRVTIDRSLCNGYGVCEALAPDVFVLDDEGLAIVKQGVSEDDAVREACDNCPMGAITLTKVEAA
jgi:ferredoxin